MKCRCPNCNFEFRSLGGDIIILDIGCKYRGYCSDTSRTVFVGGISDEEEKVYNIVRRANEAGEKIAREGVCSENVDKAARDIIDKEGYGSYFLNRTGHGIGFAVHEAPYIRTGNKQILKKGMAFSVEPGIYIKEEEIGIRIEDDILVTEDGYRILSASIPKEIEDLGKLCGLA
jgi:Xaa-Pro dipeptidase